MVNPNSYFLGQVVGTAHLMELLLQEVRGKKTFAESSLEAFTREPLFMYNILQVKLESMCYKLEEMGKFTLIGELDRIYENYDIFELTPDTFSKHEFLQGFYQQKAWGRIAIRRHKCV